MRDWAVGVSEGPLRSTALLLAQQQRFRYTSRTLPAAAQRPLFARCEGLGSGGVVFAWSARGALLAVAGQPRAVLLLARDGGLAHTLELPAPDFAYVDRLPCTRQLQARSLTACLNARAQPELQLKETAFSLQMTALAGSG